MPFWSYLPPPRTAKTRSTNFLWELGALGVVEEEIPGVPPRLRAFFAESMSSTRLLRGFGTTQASLRSLARRSSRTPPTSRPLGRGLGQRLQQSFPARESAAASSYSPVDRAARGLGPLDRDQSSGTRLRTGHHGTTEGCLVLVEEALAATPNAPTLDIGPAPGSWPSRRSSSARPACSRSTWIRTPSRHSGQCGAERLRRPDGPAGRAGGGRRPVPTRLANLLTHTHLTLASSTRAGGAGGDRWCWEACSRTGQPREPGPGRRASRSIATGPRRLGLAAPRGRRARDPLPAPAPTAIHGDRVTFEAGAAITSGRVPPAAWWEMWCGRWTRRARLLTVRLTVIAARRAGRADREPRPARRSRRST